LAHRKARFPDVTDKTGDRFADGDFRAGSVGGRGARRTRQTRHAAFASFASRASTAERTS
jgi:hypothetical protein